MRSGNVVFPEEYGHQVCFRLAQRWVQGRRETARALGENGKGTNLPPPLNVKTPINVITGFSDTTLLAFWVKVEDRKCRGTVRHAVMRPNTTRAKVRAAQFFFW